MLYWEGSGSEGVVLMWTEAGLADMTELLCQLPLQSVLLGLLAYSGLTWMLVDVLEGIYWCPNCLGLLGLLSVALMNCSNSLKTAPYFSLSLDRNSRCYS